MRAVLDTNIVVAGLLWRGPSNVLLGHVMGGRLQCCSSAPLIAELERVLGYGKLAGRIGSLNTTATRLADDYRTLVEMAIVADISRAIKGRGQACIVGNCIDTNRNVPRSRPDYEARVRAMTSMVLAGERIRMFWSSGKRETGRETRETGHAWLVAKTIVVHEAAAPADSTVVA